MELQRVGYWGDDQDGLPRPDQLVDANWSANERQDVADYLRRGFVARASMGYALCRMCKRQLGDLDLTDGVYVWPEGLDHYISAHDVCLPAWFVDHVHARQGAYEGAATSDRRWRDWWQVAGK